MPNMWFPHSWSKLVQHALSAWNTFVIKTLDLLASFGVTLLCVLQPGILLLIWPYLLQALLMKQTNITVILCVVKRIAEMLFVSYISVIRYVVLSLPAVSSWFELLFFLKGSFALTIIAPLFTVNFVSLRPLPFSGSVVNCSRSERRVLNVLTSNQFLQF